ncbi:MAG: hypothetical protein WCY77_11915 [Weeksellaceae bacterium]
MKKLILLCSFGLLGSFALAGNSIEKEPISLQQQSSDEVDYVYVFMNGEWTCVPVTFSCGGGGWACGYTTAEIIANALLADKIACPFGPQ